MSDYVLKHVQATNGNLKSNAFCSWTPKITFMSLFLFKRSHSPFYDLFPRYYKLSFLNKKCEPNCLARIRIHKGGQTCKAVKNAMRCLMLHSSHLCYVAFLYLRPLVTSALTHCVSFIDLKWNTRKEMRTTAWRVSMQHPETSTHVSPQLQASQNCSMHTQAERLHIAVQHMTAPRCWCAACWRGEVASAARFRPCNRVTIFGGCRARSHESWPKIFRWLCWGFFMLLEERSLDGWIGWLNR